MTAYNPPSNLFFSGITFNPDIIEQGDTVISGGVGDVTLAGNNNFTGTNSFTGGSINVTTQTAGNNTTLAASTAYVDSAVAGVGGVSLAGNNVFTGTNDFTNGVTTNQLITSSIEGNGTSITIDSIGNGTTFSGAVNCDYTFGCDNIDSRTAGGLFIGSSGLGSTTAVIIGSDTVGVTIGAAPTVVNISNIDTVNIIAESIDLLSTGYINAPNIYNPASILLVGDATTGVDLLGVVTAPTQTAGNNTTRVATTAFVTAAVAAAGGVSLSGTNNWTGANSFTGGSITMTTQTAGNNSTFGASTAFVTAANTASITALKAANNTWTGTLNSFVGSAITMSTQTTGTNTANGASCAFVNNSITALKAAANTWSGTNALSSTGSFDCRNGSIVMATQALGSATTFGASTAFVANAITALKSAANTWSGSNNFTTGSIDVTTQTAGNNTTLAASTAFVTNAISALSSVYQTAAQVTTAISTALSGFLGTANLWTANQDLHLVDVYVKNQTQGTGNTTAASTFYTDLAVTNSISTGYANIMANINNYTGVNTFTNDTFVPTIATGTNTTNAASSAFVNASITAMKAAANTFSGANNFTTGSIDVTTQTAGNNTTLAASTAFVTAAISALSSVYQTAAQVSTAISSALTTFLGTANTFTANQIFPTIQFSSGTLNQAFYFQYVNSRSFGNVPAGSITPVTFSYATLGLTNYSTLLTVIVSNSSSAANGPRVIFTVSAQSGSSLTITGMNPTGTAAAASAFSLILLGR